MKMPMGEIKAAQREWEENILRPREKERDEWKKEFKTASGKPVKAVYSPNDLADQNFDYLGSLGFPGLFPFTRGNRPNMFRENLWIRSQIAGFGSAEDLNKRWKYNLQHGSTGTSIAWDLPTQMGLDSDDPLAEGEVGKVGVAVDTLRDMEIVFEGIKLNQARQISTTANAIGPIFLAMMLAIAEKQGLSPNEYRLSIQNEPLKEFVARGAYIFPPLPSLKFAIDVVEYCRHYREWKTLCPCGYHIREAGSTAVQEIAFTLANAMAYIDEALRRGLGIDDFVFNFRPFFACGLDLFEEVAKIRAFRRIWAQLMHDSYGAKDPTTLGIATMGFTAGSTLTAQQPLNNIARVAIEALVSVLCGHEALSLSSFDEALSTPSEKAVKVALATQQIIAYETGVANVVDAMGGSYYLEWMTNEIEKEAYAYLDRIKELGGPIVCIENGYFKGEIEESAYQIQKGIIDEDRLIVGVNTNNEDDHGEIKPFRVDPASVEKQAERLRDVKRERDNRAVAGKLKAIERVARDNKNLVLPIYEAVKEYSTIGEICSALGSVWGYMDRDR